jgi:hypothetical protein
MYVYVRACMRMCVCVCEWEREKTKSTIIRGNKDSSVEVELRPRSRTLLET